MSDIQSTGQTVAPAEDLTRIIESARRLGVELDEGEALQWLTAMASVTAGSDIVVDSQSGVFGHKVTMLDFSPQELVRFREIGKIVELYDRPGVVETALALSGSAAQSKIQSYPGDCDYFERVNIIAPTREEAGKILGDLMREKVLSTEKGPNYQFIEVKYGNYPFNCTRRGKAKHKGTPISWTIDEVKAGETLIEHEDGTPGAIKWEDHVMEPGWCKLDWVVADPMRHTLANASNVLDVTWEAPDGSITPLDGYLDAYFQEVYLDAASVPIFSKVAKHVSADALDEYVARLEGEVRKYLTEHVNYGKAAKRMYNVFRLTGKYHEAAFIRELFDEPATILYQVWSLIGTLDNATQTGSTISMESVVAQADELIMMVVNALEGEAESEVVRSLLRLKNAITRQADPDVRDAEIDGAKTQVINVINTFFQERLNGLPTIQEYISTMQAGEHEA
jgi:hypothetical protein